MDPITMGLIAAGVGGLKHSLIDRPQFKEQSKIEALKTAYNPILGTMGDVSNKPSGIQTMLDFGVKGAALGHALGKGAEGAVPAGDAKAKATGAVDKSNMMSGTGVNQLSFAPEAGTNYGAMTNQTLSDVNPNMSLMPDTGVNRLSFMDNQQINIPPQTQQMEQMLYQQPYFGATQAPQSQAPRFGINQIRMYR